MHDIRSRAARSLRRGLYLLGLCSVACLHARDVHAEELARRQNLVFSGERLFGFYLDNQTVDRGDRNDTTHHTVLGVGWNSPPSLLALPRVGVDYFVSNGFTLGGNLGFVSRSDAGNTVTSFILGLRVGYALRLGHAVSFWPRGGLTFASSDVEHDPADTHVLSLTLDAPFTFAPTEGFAFLLGPALELGFLGKRVGSDASEVMFGLMFGLAGWTGL